MAANFIPSGAEYFRIMPELILTLVATLLMILEALFDTRHSRVFANISLAGLGAAFGAAILAFSNPGPAFQNMLIIDGFATFFRVLVIIVGLLTILCSIQYL